MRSLPGGVDLPDSLPWLAGGDLGGFVALDHFIAFVTQFLDGLGFLELGFLFLFQCGERSPRLGDQSLDLRGWRLVFPGDQGCVEPGCMEHKRE